MVWGEKEDIKREFPVIHSKKINISRQANPRRMRLTDALASMSRIREGEGISTRNQGRLRFQKRSLRKGKKHWWSEAHDDIIDLKPPTDVEGNQRGNGLRRKAGKNL